MYIWILAIALGYIAIKWLLRQPRVGNLNDKYVFITGCDSGFGNLLAKKLDNLGMKVIAGCLTEKGETDLVKTSSNKLKTVFLDVTSESSVATAAEEVKKLLPKTKGLWAVVNNAGVGGCVYPIEWTSLEEFEKTLSVNLYGVINVTKAFLPLIRRETGRVINMSSIAGRFASVSAPYSISKFGVEAFSDTLRRELYATGITVHMLEPGFFDTPLVRAYTPEAVKCLAKDRYEKLPQEIKESYGEEFIEKIVERGSKVRNYVDPDLNKVVDAYVDAVTARYPKARYIIGNDANYLVRLLWNLPEWLSDYIIYKMRS